MNSIPRPLAALAVGIFSLTLAACPAKDDKAGDKPAADKPAATGGPAAAASKPAAAAAAAPKTKGAILAQGTIKLAKGAKAVGKMIFVSLRPIEAKGPPIAAMRLPPGPFPMPFALTEANIVAMGGQKREVPPEFKLKVALDTDGNPMVKSPEDLIFEVTANKGAKGLEMVLAPAGG